MFITSYRYRQRDGCGSDLGIQIHGYRDEHRHRNGYRNIFPHHTIFYICRHRKQMLFIRHVNQSITASCRLAAPS